MKIQFKFLLTISLGFFILSSMNAQPPGGRGPGGGTGEMMKREKQAVFEKIENLTEDQKLLMDGIYSEFSATLKETFQEARKSGNREGIREKMMALRKEKDKLISDVLNESQFEIYKSITSRQRQRQRQRRGNNSSEEPSSN